MSKSKEHEYAEVHSTPELLAFGARAREARLSLPRRDSSRERVAQAVGVASSSIGRWEAGVCWPSVDLVLRLSRVLRVQPSYLLAVDVADARYGAEVQS